MINCLENGVTKKQKKKLDDGDDDDFFGNFSITPK